MLISAYGTYVNKTKPLFQGYENAQLCTFSDLEKVHGAIKFQINQCWFLKSLRLFFGPVLGLKLLDGPLRRSSSLGDPKKSKGTLNSLSESPLGSGSESMSRFSVPECVTLNGRQTVLPPRI